MDMSLIRPVGIFDTTLRDGEQAPGYSLDPEQKLQIAMSLERLGVNTIETGFPASSPLDHEATREICRTLRRATLSAFSRVVPEDIEACATAMQEATRPQIQLASVASDIHIEYKRKATRAAILQEAIAAVDHAKEIGFADISIALEDATRGVLGFMKQLIGASIERGAASVVIADTVGCCLPAEFFALIKSVREFVGDDIRISIHCHNDLGLAVANSLAGISAGADEVQVTLCGIGERAGNASMEELVAVLSHKIDVLHRRHDIVQHRLFETCSLLANTLKISVPFHKPIIGRNAFATEAGMHQHGVLKHRFTYEFMRAEDFGTESATVIGRHSGRKVLQERLQQSGVRSVDPAVLDKLYVSIMSGADVRQYNDTRLLVEHYKFLSSQATTSRGPSVGASLNGATQSSCESGDAQCLLPVA